MHLTRRDMTSNDNMAEKFFHNLGGPKQPSFKKAVADEAKHVKAKSQALKIAKTGKVGHEIKRRSIKGSSNLEVRRRAGSKTVDMLKKLQ